MPKFYITTTLPYVNAAPHIGFALEIVQADVVARAHRVAGDDVFLNTGTDEHGTKIYQSQIFVPYVFVIDPGAQTVTKRINVGGRPLDLALTPDRRYLYIANYDLNELEKIDTETDSVVERIPHVPNARGIAITRDGRFAFVTNVLPSTVTVVDLASAAIVKVIPVGTMPTSVAFRADGKCAYVTCQGSASLFVIDTQTQEIVRSIVVDSNPIQVQVK